MSDTHRSNSTMRDSVIAKAQSRVVDADTRESERVYRITMLGLLKDVVEALEGMEDALERIERAIPRR